MSTEFYQGKKAYHGSIAIELPDGDFDGGPLGVEGEQVAAGVHRGWHQHQEAELLPHPHPTVEPVRESGVLGSSIQLKRKSKLLFSFIRFSNAQQTTGTWTRDPKSPWQWYNHWSQTKGWFLMKVIICNYGQGIRRSWNWKNPTDIENKVIGSTPGPNKPLLLRS